MDERRRRRLAVNGDGPAADGSGSGEEKSLPDCVPAEWCAASPWIPRAAWKLWTLVGLLFAGLVGIAVVFVQAPTFRSELAPALEPLFRSDNPRLIHYLEIVFWTLAGQLALLVGWHRAHSRLDFRGRYRIWPWAAVLMFVCGACSATSLHANAGLVVHQTVKRTEAIQPIGLNDRTGEQLAWMVPAIGLLLPTWLFLDRDIRRSLAAIMLMRLAAVMLVACMGLGLYGQRFLPAEQVSQIKILCGLFGAATLAVAMWVQGWYVAYVTPDPPVSKPWKFPQFKGNLFSWLIGLIMGLFRRNTPAAPPSKRRKKAEETGATKRKRKTKRAAKPRKKVVEEEEDEEVAEDEAAEADEEEESAEEEAAEEEEDEMPPARGSAVNKPHFAVNASRPAANAKSGSVWGSESNDDEDEEDEGSGDEDGPPADMLKGLSKRQRRAVQKQWREDQRTQRGR